MRIVLWFSLLLFSYSAGAQGLVNLFSDFKRIDLPFELRNHLMVVDVELNRTFHLKFIFDTGAENTILAKKEVTDLLKIPYEREFKILGSDMKTELTAYLVRNIHFKVKDLIIPAHSMLVLAKDYFRFEEVAGIELHGILGADVFRNLVVKINYDRKVITLMKRQHFDLPKGYEKIPIEISRSKPYLKTDIEIVRGSPLNVKLLLDSGSMLPFIIHTNTDSSLHLPPLVVNGRLGAGLGGFLEGYVGRTHSLQIGQRTLNGVVTHFQDISESIDTSLLNGRNGIIGNPILARYHVIIDYPKGVLYLRPNRKFRKPFEFDKSGLVLIAADVRLRSFIVHDVIRNSPAYEAGLHPRDRIVAINGIPSVFLSLNNINKILSRKEGKKIKLKIKRKGEKKIFRFQLRKLI